MAIEGNYSDSFDFAGHRFEAEFEPIIGEAIDSIREEVFKNNHPQARKLAIGSSLSFLSRDGETIIKKAPRAQRRAGGQSYNVVQGLPGDYDDATDEFVYDRLVSIIVANVPWLAKRPGFAPAFEAWAPEDAPKKDPTPLRAETQKTGS